MTAYNSIAASSIDADSPVTVTLMTRLRDNPIAITEGSSGAPKIQNAAFDANEISVTKIDWQTENITFDAISTASPGSTDWVVPAGLHMLIATAATTPANLDLQIYDGSTWQTSVNAFGGGLIWSDGTNVRLLCSTAQNVTIKYRKIG